MRKEEGAWAGFQAPCGACGVSFSLCCRRWRSGFADHNDGARRVDGQAEHAVFGEKWRWKREMPSSGTRSVSDVGVYMVGTAGDTAGKMLHVFVPE